MPAIFISHSSRDQKIADDITAAIKRLGFEEVFLDFNPDTGIGAGADWEKTLYEKLARCHALILVLTPNWLASTWCRIELSQARALGKVILPVICAPLMGTATSCRKSRPSIWSDWNSEASHAPSSAGRAPSPTSSHAASGSDPNRPPSSRHPWRSRPRTRPSISVATTRPVRSSSGWTAAAPRWRALPGRDRRVRLRQILVAQGGRASSSSRAACREWLVLPPMRPGARAGGRCSPSRSRSKLGKPDPMAHLEARRCPARLRPTRSRELLKELQGPAKRAPPPCCCRSTSSEKAFTVAKSRRACDLSLSSSQRTALDPARGLPLMSDRDRSGPTCWEGLSLNRASLRISPRPIRCPPMPLRSPFPAGRGPAAMAGHQCREGAVRSDRARRGSSDALPLLAPLCGSFTCAAEKAKKLDSR